MKRGKMARRGTKVARCLGAIVAVLLLLAFTGTSAAEAAPAPSWKITAVSTPTNFEPGASVPGGGRFTKFPQFTIFATNMGPSLTSGEFTIAAELSEGVTPVSAAGKDQAGNEVECTVEEQAVTCTDLGEEPLEQGRWFEVVIPVNVSRTAPAQVTAEATITGGGATLGASTTASAGVSDSSPQFALLPGSSGLSAIATNAEGLSEAQAAAHPYQFTLVGGFPSKLAVAPVSGAAAEFTGAGHVKDLTVKLPRGMVVDPQATPVRCTEAELESFSCPLASQVGMISIRTSLIGIGNRPSSLYNMVPPPGVAAELATNALQLGIFVHLDGGVDAEGDYELTATTSDILARELNPVLGFEAQLWGRPSDESHDSQRGEECVQTIGERCPVEREEGALLTMPGSCASGPILTASADSWEAPGVTVGRSVPLEAAGGGNAALAGCDELRFDPSITISPEVSSAETPTGLHVDLHIPQNEEYEQLAEANLEAARVVLPAGMAVNPSAANGLGACTAAEVDLHGGGPASCPDDSKIGTVQVDTPLLDHPLPGAIYVAEPYQNPFGSLLAIYVVVADPKSGVVIKLAGHVEADPQTGQLTTTFSDNPQLPFEDFKLDFFGGPRAALKTPNVCGTFASQSELSPWSGMAAVTGRDPFQITAGANGGGCVDDPAQLPNTPSFEAGTVNPAAGAFSPFVLHLKREDGTQTIKGLNVNLPPGLLAKLAGIPYCSDAALASAATRSGAEEQASPSCPLSSEVGNVTVAAGAGSHPYYVTGKAYLAGPYKGAPLSLAIITPAVAGPYDLGTVVVRSAAHVNQETAQISVNSDPIPTILKGIPLDIRSISVEMDRREFTRNPTSCEAMTVGGEMIAASGQTAGLSSRFQVGGCSSLVFKPKLKLQVIGKTNRNANPRLKAVLTTKPGEANIRRAQVNLPHSMFLEQGHIKTVCTRVQWEEGNGNGSACPKGSIYGHAKAWTPLLEKPLGGYVYLRSNGGERKLPDLVAALDGQVSIALWGKTDSGKNNGLRDTFEVVPDAPVSRFVLELNGKKKGLLVNSEDLCSKKAKRNAIVRFTGQNGKVESFKPKVAAKCGGTKKKKSGRKK